MSKNGFGFNKLYKPADELALNARSKKKKFIIAPIETFEINNREPAGIKI
jgi:hypothetical protein